MTESQAPSPAFRVRRALEDIYVRFAAPTPPRIDGCPCCIGGRRVDVLLAKPLRELTGEDLWPYVSGVFLTVGSVRDFRYLLPRILEISVCGLDALPDVEIVLGKLRLAGWETWPPAERKPIEALVDAWFDQALAADLLEAEDWLAASETDAVLCGAARADIDLAPLLNRLATPAAEPVRTFLVQHYAKHLAKGSTPNSFWIDAPDGWRAFAQVLSAH